MARLRRLPECGYARRHRRQLGAEHQPAALRRRSEAEDRQVLARFRQRPHDVEPGRSVGANLLHELTELGTRHALHEADVGRAIERARRAHGAGERVPLFEFDAPAGVEQCLRGRGGISHQRDPADDSLGDPLRRLVLHDGVPFGFFTKEQDGRADASDQRQPASEQHRPDALASADRRLRFPVRAARSPHAMASANGRHWVKAKASTPLLSDVRAALAPGTSPAARRPVAAAAPTMARRRA